MKFEIYQLKSDESLHFYRFLSLDKLKLDGTEVKKANYDKVYEDVLEDGVTLEDLFCRFNINRPADFTGHSLSVSDVITIVDDDSCKAYYVDDIGFAEIPSF